MTRNRCQPGGRQWTACSTTISVRPDGDAAAVSGRIADVPAFDEALTGPEAAPAWLDAERTNLVVVAGHAARHGRPDHTTALAATLYRYLDSGYLKRRPRPAYLRGAYRPRGR